MKRILFILFIPLFFTLAQAQNDKIITVQGDTLIGKVSVFNTDNNSETIILKIDKEKTVFKVYQVKALIKDDEVYRTIKINKAYQLGQLKKEGYLSIYNYTAIDDDTSRPFSSTILIKLDGSQLVVPNLGFKKHLKIFLEDCNTVVNNFEADSYKKSELGKIVDDYNKCITENTDKLNRRLSTGNHNNEQLAEINSLIADIKNDKTLKDLDTVVEMLNDLAGKKKSNTKVPSYLESVLRESLKNDPGYSEKIDNILKEE